MHAPITRSVTVLAFLVACALPMRAAAVDLRDARTGFQVNLAAAGAKTCVAFPQELRNEADCPEVAMPDASAVVALVPADARNNVSALGAVYFVNGTAVHFMLAMSAPNEEGAELSHDEAAQLVREFVGGMMPHGAPMTPVFDLLTVNGVQVVRHVETLPASAQSTADAPTKVLVYHLNGARGLVHMIFYAQGDTLPAVQANAAAVVNSVAMPPPVPRARRIGRMVGRMMLPLVVLGIIAAIVAFVARRNSGGSPPPPPPGGPGSPWNGPSGAPPFGAPSQGPFGAPSGTGGPGWGPPPTG